MTYLVLLVSVAVLEYILRRAEPMPRRRQSTEMEELNQNPTDTGPTSLAESLGNLGKAVDQFGRGSTPAAPPQADSPERDVHVKRR